MNPLILLVEDDESIRHALHLILHRQGYRTVEATNGVESLRIAHEHRPEAILMDLALPELDGLEATTLLKQDPATACIPVIAMTASWLGGDTGRLQAAGFQGALRKPFTPDGLAAELQRVLNDGKQVPGNGS